MTRATECKCMQQVVMHMSHVQQLVAAAGPKILVIQNKTNYTYEENCTGLCSFNIMGLSKLSSTSREAMLDPCVKRQCKTISQMYAKMPRQKSCPSSIDIEIKA